MKKFYFIIINILIFVCGIALGYYFSNYKAISPLENKINNDNFQTGWDAAEKRMMDLGYIQEIPSTQSIKTVGGEILANNNNVLKLKINPLEPLANPDLDQREIIYNKDTKILKYDKIDEALYKKESDEYWNNVAKDPNFDPQQALMPAQYKLVNATTADLIPGLTVEVKSISDLKTAKKISAETITILMQ